ncbi:hypothetical protein T484DRAFT_1960532 [Baffinella frigidus]|nr:hypothetical protein T484DRAFT_1960532 [Cryptophyta sp. CCMP2293]
MREVMDASRNDALGAAALLLVRQIVAQLPEELLGILDRVVCEMVLHHHRFVSRQNQHSPAAFRRPKPVAPAVMEFGFQIVPPELVRVAAAEPERLGLAGFTKASNESLCLCVVALGQQREASVVEVGPRGGGPRLAAG